MDLELAIRRRPGRLDGGKIGGDHPGGRELVGEVHRPEAGAGADVQHFLRAGADGRLEQVAVEQ